jgi:hypothetical protein
MGLHTYTVGYGGIVLFILGCLGTPAIQKALTDELTHPTVANSVGLVGLTAGLLAAWLGKSPTSTPSGEVAK